MASDRTTLRTSAAVERRPPAASRVQRSSAEIQQSPAQTLQSRLGNRATQVLISRAVAHGKESAAKHTRLPAKVSKPTDPAELEAEETARKVMRMSQPATKPVVPKSTGAKTVQRAEATPGPTTAHAPTPAPTRAATSRVSISGGAPLPTSVRTHMEPRFGANFSNVRVHTDSSAAQQSSRLGASAFTVGEHIFFGKDKFQPQSTTGNELIAHELTHTIQQQAVVQRQVDTTVTQRSEPRIQRWSISDGLDWIADKANYLPGFRMLTIVLGVNPINMAAVSASPANILRALLEMVPVTGALVAEALDEYGIFEKVGGWIAGQVEALGLVGSSLKSALMEFLESLSWSDIFDLDDVYERGKRIFTAPIDQLIDFITGLITDILVFIRDAILLPLAKLAEGTEGYDLLKAVLGKDPFTDEKVTPTPEVLIGGFMKLIGQQEVWENAQKANAVPRLWAWFQGALSGLMGFVSQIPDLIITTLESLEIGDLFPPTKAFVKVATAFGGFVMQFITWAGQTVWTLLEIIFDVVSPGAFEYVKKTGAALQSILQNPIAFVGNLVKAAKLGFDKFSDNFLQHLKAGLIEWLVGALPGIYIPQAFSLIEIAKFVFSALGLTWENIRQKLVKAIGETAVKALETTFDIVVTLVTEGPAAAWDQIKDQLAKLKDMVIGGIIDMIVGAVVKKAIPKLIAMFIPGAGFISAILSIYDTVMVFVDKIKKIAAVVKTFVDSIVAIAQGEIGGAAARVERAFAGVLSLAINFLAGFAGLGKVADKVMEIINKVRAPIDKALDWLVNWIVTAAKKAGKFLLEKGKSAKDLLFEWWKKKETFSDKKGKSHKLFFAGSGANARLKVASAEMFTEEFIAKVQKVFAEDPLAKTFGLRYLNLALEKKRDIDKLKIQLEGEKKRKEPSAKFTDEKIQSLMRELAGNMMFLFDILPENKFDKLPVATGSFVTIPYRKAERKAEILFVSTERVNYEIESAKGFKHYLKTPDFIQQWNAGIITPYVEKGARETYLGATPGKASATGKKVIAKYKTEVQKGVVMVEWKPGEWWPLADCDMSHDPVDAVKYWNKVRKDTFPKSPMVREWMLDANNYILEPAHINRSRGAREGDKYLPP